LTEKFKKSRTRRLETLNLVSFIHRDADDRVDLQSVGRTLDLSEGGILLETPQPVPAGNNVVDITLGIREHVIHTLGEIVHQRVLENGNFGIGIAFSNLSSEDSLAIKNFLDEDDAE
jgi:hypothetical protein